MKENIGTPIYNTFRHQPVVDISHELIVEWNYNRHINVSAFNDPPELVSGFDLEMFPIDSLVENNRPTSGIVRARESESEVSFTYQDRPDAARYYVTDVNDIYKYWTGPTQSEHDPPHTFPLGDDGFTTIKPAITYTRPVEINKIVFTFEVSFRSPDDGSTIFSKPLHYEVFLQYEEDGLWQSVGSDWPIPDSGQVVLWLNEFGWQNSLQRKISTVVRGIQIRVYEMDRKDAFLNMIEISGRLEADLSKYLVTSSDQWDIGERSFITPLGKASSNTASVTLFNGSPPRAEDRYSWLDGNFIEDQGLGAIFNNLNQNSPFCGIIDANVKMTLSNIFDAGAQGGPIDFKVQAFEMFTTLWSGQLDDSVIIDLKDYSTFFQAITPPKVLYENNSLGRIVWQLCDLCGFNNYNVTQGESDKILNIDIFWTDGTKTLWEIFSELAEVTQSAIYFDAYNVLQIRTRESLFDKDVSPAWILRADSFDNEIADIVDYTPTYQYGANYVTVNYQPASFGDFTSGYPVQEIVWQATDTVVLRETPLVKDLVSDDEFMWIGPHVVRIWPFKAMVQIGAELISYDGKEFVYYTGSQRNRALVHSQEEFESYNNLTPPPGRFKNHYTGKLAVVERAIWNSEEKDHLVEANAYSVRSIRNGNGAHNTTAGGFKQNKLESSVTLKNNTSFKWNDWLLATRGTEDDGGFFYYGTRMKFNDVKIGGQRAGLVINNNGNTEAGYYVEFRPTRLMNPVERKIANEVYFYAKTDDGKMHPLGDNKGTGEPFLIIEDEWFEVDISFHIDQDLNHFVGIWVNGRHVMGVEIDNGSGWRQTSNGKFGMFERGYTSVDFDYLYATTREIEQPLDDMSFLDRVTSGYMGNIFQREWVYRTRQSGNRKRKKSKKEEEKYAGIFLDEFGPILHEVREFNVNFDNGPVISSSLLITNDDKVLCPQYNSDAFTADFVLVNAARMNAVVSGDDALSFPGETVTQQLIVFGNGVIQDNPVTIVSKDDLSIKRRGKIDVEFSSQWLQNERAAQRLSDWIISQWSNGIEEIEVQTFGNPLFELGDVIEVEYARKNLIATDNRYFVVGIANTYGPGMETVLTLRLNYAIPPAPNLPPAPPLGIQGAVFSPEWAEV